MSEAAAMKISAIAPWFGSKRTLAPVIVQELGKHSAYWEPFCGSMAVLMSKPECRMETANDLHGDLINMARIIQSKSGSELYRRLRRVLMHEDLVAESKGQLAKPFEEGVDRAFWFFIQSWVTRNGVAGTKDFNQNFCRRFTSNGGGPAVRLASAVDSIPSWRQRMRRVCILRMDAFELLERVEDKVGAVIYVDPPYLKKGAEYTHDFDWLAHRRLAKLLRRFTSTRIIVSYYDHFDLTELYPSPWVKRNVFTLKNMVNQSQQKNRAANTSIAPEVLLINGPSYAGGGA